MLRWFRKRLALRSYRRKLGPALAKRYGRQKHYTIQQVRKTADVLGLNVDYLCYAYAAHCERDDFVAHHETIGESCDWAEMREELAEAFGFTLDHGHVGVEVAGHDDGAHHGHWGDDHDMGH